MNHCNGGSGPTRSMWMVSNRASGVGKGGSGVVSATESWLDARACPSAYISINTWPIVLGCDEPL